MNSFNWVQEIAIWALPVLFGITVHEVAHGWVALLLGDKTAWMLGRLTLNPFKHVDPVGTILVPLLSLSIGGFMFGWAKPVPITWRNLKHPRRDTALVAIAGPMANALMMIAWALGAKLALSCVHMGFEQASFLVYMAQAGITMNVLLMVVNLIPIPPLDGSRVLASFLPQRLALVLDRIEPYGFIILIVLMASKTLSVVLNPLISNILSCVNQLLA
ncbi:MAG: site-2 protease family protein [Gammaproteobacteria bacterium]|nr:site-2 protease family protein [Gammaproteobacteria bacterium]MBP9729002.1 site-2 protease family protein [Gammaproteobacteria bacterium]